MCSQNQWCHGKAGSITYSECVSITFIIKHAVCLAVPHFSTLSHKQHDFWKKATEHKHTFWLYTKLLSETHLTLKRIHNNIIINYIDLQTRRPLFWSHFNETWIFLADFQNTLKFDENPFSGSQVVPCRKCKRTTFTPWHYRFVGQTHKHFTGYIVPTT